MSYILISIGLTIGNFIYAYFGVGDYSGAIENSYFQAIAISTVYWSDLLKQRWNSKGDASGRFCEHYE
jgi:hypothetical protein